MKSIEITISSTGKATVQTHGFIGRECREASQFIEAALGKRTSEALTSEFHQTANHNSAAFETEGRTQRES